MNPHLLPKVRCNKIMDLPKNEYEAVYCTIRISSLVPGLRCSTQDTLIMAHLPIWGSRAAQHLGEAGENRLRKKLEATHERLSIFQPAI